MDGGSSDKTIEIIKKYEPWITFWASGKDNGQASAINMGWRRSTGEIVSYLNSDDTFLKNTLSVVGACFEQNIKTGLIYGDSFFVDYRGRKLNTYKGKSYDQKMLFCWALGIGQPAVFFKRMIFDTTGYLNEDLRYVMDFDFWLRVSLHHSFLHIPVPLATMRLHPGAKTVRDFSVFYLDELKSLQTIFSLPDISPEIKQYEMMAYAHSYLRAGYRDFQLGEMKDARHLLLIASRKYPRFLLNPIHFVILLMTFLPVQFVRKLYRVKASILKRKNFVDLLLESNI
jgi:glycosyltransferase involved in cell wall biosynthesis